MASFHITKSAVSQTSWFIKHIEIVAGMTNTKEILDVLELPAEQKREASVPHIVQLFGAELVVNHTLDVLESTGWSSILCNVCIKKFPLLEVAACISPDPITTVPEHLKADFAQFAASPDGKIAVITSYDMPDGQVHHTLHLIARKSAPVEKLEPPVVEPPVVEPPVVEPPVVEPPDNIGPIDANRLETVD